MNKLLAMITVLALGALGFVLFRQRPNQTKTVMLEPVSVLNAANSIVKNTSAKSAGSLRDLTRDTPKPRPVTTDAVVPSTPKPSSKFVQTTKQPETVTPRVEVVTPRVEPKITPTLQTPPEKPVEVRTPPKPETTSIQPAPTSQAASSSSSVITAPAPTMPLRREPGKISIQAGAFKNPTYAQTLSDQLSKQGLNASVELGKDGISRVIVGPYPTEEAARAVATKISGR